MSYNGSGTFNINSAGQPVVTGTVISSTAFNALTADLGTGLSTALTKDGQTTPTANIPMGTYKITGLGAGTVATDAVRLSQLQNGGTTTYITAAGTDTITGTVTPALTAYATGQQFSFVVAATNTTAVTLNVDSVGAKAVTRTGSVALVAGDMVTGQVVIVEYDGTRFQLINGNSFTNLKASGTLNVTGLTTLGVTGAVFPGSTSGTATIVAPAAAGSGVLTLPVATDTLVGKATTDTLTNKTLTAPTITGASITLAASAAPAFSATSSAGTAMTNATYVKVTFDTERFDTNSNFASSRFTPTVAGYYQVNTHLVYLCSTVTQIVLAFYKNGVVDTYTNFLPYVANASSINCSYIVQMNGSTDYLEVFFYIAGTGSLSTQGGAQTIFNGAMIRSA